MRIQTITIMNKLLHILVVFLFATTTYGQSTLTGIVKEAGTNETLPGVSILVKGTQNGTSTDFDGKFSIEVNKGDILELSFMGFVTQQITYSNQSNLQVILQPDSKVLNDVVVTALNIKRDKASLGYSVSQVDAGEVNVAKSNNVMEGLNGKVSGLQISTGNTGVDGSTRILLRGVTTIEGNNRPLVVIDGIPMDNSSGGGSQWGQTDKGDALSDINPDDIESMSVLKGAGASAAYGSLGMHGVILITTKSGTKKNGVGVSFNSNFTATQIALTPKLQNEYGSGAFDQFAPIGSDGIPNLDYPFSWSYGPKMQGQDYTNWLGEKDNYTSNGDPYKDFYQTGLSFTNSVAFQGTTDKGSFRLSFTDQRSEGILVNNTLKKQTYNLRASHKFAKNFNVDGKITYIKSRVKNRPYLAESGANSSLILSTMPRDVKLDDAKNNFEDANGNEQFWSADNYMYNPYWVRKHIDDSSDKDRFQGMISAKLDLTSNFYITARTGLDYSLLSSTSHTDRGLRDSSWKEGTYGNSKYNGTIWDSNILATYKTSFGRLEFVGSLGANYRLNKGSSIGVYGQNSKSDNLYNISNYLISNSGDGSSSKLVYAYYGLGQFSYNNYLYLDVTVRNDHSSALPKDNSSYWYHSENLSFLFSELLGITSDFFSRGKLRASYAKVGNDTSPYRTENTYYYSQYSTLDYPVVGIPRNLPSNDLRPEITHSWEVGAELSFFKSRLNFDMTYYQSKSIDQIMSIPIPSTTGFTSKVINAGSISGKGFEMQINGTPIQTNDFSWNIGLTYTKSKSVVDELAEGLSSIELNRLWTVSVEARPGEEFGGIYGNDFKRNEAGEKLIDDNGISQRGERVKLGNMNPDFFGGISNNFTYKNLSLRTLISYQVGGNFYSHGRYYRMLFGTDARSLEGRENGIIIDGVNENTGKANDVAIPTLTKNFSELYLNEITKDFILDASHVKLKEVVITYNIPLKSKVIQGMSVSLVGRDLLFIYNAADDIDPLSSYNSSPTGIALNHSSLPSTRSYGIDFKFNF